MAGIGTYKADSELACARRCCSQKECSEAVFSEVTWRCSLYNANEMVLAEFQADSQEANTGYVRIKKVH